MYMLHKNGEQMRMSHAVLPMYRPQVMKENRSAIAASIHAIMMLVVLWEVTCCDSHCAVAQPIPQQRVVRIGPNVDASQWKSRTSSVIDLMERHAGEILPFLQSDQLSNYIQKEFDDYKREEVEHLNRFARLRQDESPEGVGRYNTAIQQAVEAAEAEEQQFIESIIMLGNHSDLRVFVMILIQSKRLEAIAHPLCQAYWQLSDDQIAELQRIQSAHASIQARMNAAFVKARQMGKSPQESFAAVAASDRHQHLANYGQAYDLLTEQQLKEYMQYARILRPGESLRDYLSRMSPIERNALLSTCSVLRTIWQREE